MGKKKNKMESASPLVSLTDIHIGTSASGRFISPLGKGTTASSTMNDDAFSPAAVTVAETPSPGTSSARMTPSSSFQLTKLRGTTPVLSVRPSWQQHNHHRRKSTNDSFHKVGADGGDEQSPAVEEPSISPAKPFDEAVDDSGGNFEDVWASAEVDEDRMYLFARMMMTEVPEPSTTQPPKEGNKKVALPFVSPAPGTNKGKLHRHQTMDILAAIQEQSELRSTAGTPPVQESSLASHNTPSTLGDNDVFDDMDSQDSPNLIEFTPTTPKEINKTMDGNSIKPHALFKSVHFHNENKENIPPGYDKRQFKEDLAKTLSNKPGELMHTGHKPKKKQCSDESPKFDDEMPWDCVDEYAAYYEGEIRQLKKMEMQQLRELEEGMDYRSRRSLLCKVLKKEAKTYKSSKQVQARETLKSMRNISSIHPPEMIEFEIKKGRIDDSKDVFEDEPLASISLAAGDTIFEGLDRSPGDSPRFSIGNSPRKRQKKGIFVTRQVNRRRIRNVCLLVLLASFIISAVLIALFATGSMTGGEDPVQADWQPESEGQMTPVDEETKVPEYIPDSNLFEGDEIVACKNAEAISDLNRPYFGSTWKSFWDSRINTCGDQMSTGYSIWYTYSADESKLVEASTCNNADFDTQITVLAGYCDQLACVSFNDEACGSQSQVIWYAEASITYYLVISGYREASGTFGLTLSEAINNDDCFDSMGPILPGSVVAGTTAGAKNVEKPPQCGHVDMTAPGVWYEITNITGFYRAEILRGYTNFSGQVSVYRSMDELDMGCGALICDTSSPTGNVTWLAEGTEMYYLYVNGVNGTEGDFDLFIGPNVASTCKKAKKLDANTIGYFASTKRANPQNVESCGYTGYHTAPGLWFSVQGTGRFLEVSTCGSLQTLDTQISVFADSCESLQCIGGTGQDYPCGDNGLVSWKTEFGEIYHIFVSGRSSRVGEFVLDIKETEKENGYSCPMSMALELGSGSYQGSTVDAPSAAVELCEGTGAVRGIWHQLLGTGMTMRISVCNNETDYDSRLSLYHGSCDDLSCVANTRSRCGEKDEILVTTHIGQVYYLFVHGPDSFTIGKYKLDIDESMLNDSCDAAPTLELSPARYFGSTKSARTSVSEECGGSSTHSVALWYRMIGTGETATLSTCSEITDFNSDITVFTGSCSSLACVKSEGTKCGDQTSLSFQTTLDQVYYVRVGGNSTLDSGTFVMDVTNMSPFFGSG
jgi:hypothetical protein